MAHRSGTAATGTGPSAPNPLPDVREISARLPEASPLHCQRGPITGRCPMRTIAGAAVLTGVLLVGGGAWGADLEGKVQTIVIADRMVVLDDGKEVWMAEGLSMDDSKEGTEVKVVYEERDGKLVATSIEIVK